MNEGAPLRLPDPPAPAAPDGGPSSPPSRPVWALEGRKLGRYRLGPSLGRGGMGEVYEAWDTLLNRVVAVKILNAPHPNAIIRFMKEAQLQARVSHPNVCRIFDVGVWENVPFIAMQLVKGPSLFLAAPQLTLQEAVEILAAVAHAMHAAHRVNLIHRDLKPSNILLEKATGGGWIPYVADFGLAKDLEEEGLTLSHGVMGTPSFMAPEQRLGQGALIGPPTDVYALGATLCAVLNLDRDYGHTGHTHRRDRDTTGFRPSWGNIPRDLKSILIRCLEDRPQDRYPTAGALAEDFRRFLDGEPLLAEPGGWLRPLRRYFRAHPALGASLAITLGLGVGFAAWSARLTSAAKRRTMLALRFADDAKDLESSIGIERLHPPHDLSPLLRGMEEGLEKIRKDMDHLGPEAWGPGNLALGRGYLTMRYLDPALLALEEAWKSGYRTPDVAYALCKTHCEYYIRILDEEQLRDIPPSPERVAYHLQSARDYYPLAAGATWEPPELCGVMLLIFGGKEAEALLQARKLAENNPWFYEAKVEEAYAFQTLGYARQMAGDYRGAHALYAQSETVARLAQDIGRSDITCHLASLDWRIDWLENPRLRPHEALATGREAEQVVDTVLAIRPAYPRAISAKVHVILSQARALKALGRDPRPELARAERFLAGARPEFAFTWLIPIKADLIRRTKEELGYRR